MKESRHIKDLSNDAILLTRGAIREVQPLIISAEKRLRRRLQAAGRTTLAAILFLSSGLLSIGVHLSASLASANVKQTKGEKRVRGYERLKSTLSPLGTKSVSRTLVGTASWYGHGFHNRKTASGARFDQNAFTAAHKTLPFGTIVRVTNLSNNRSCFLEITDRGPYVKNRIIDVSKAAAAELDFSHRGTAKVSIEIFTTDLASDIELAIPTPAHDVMATQKYERR